MKMRWLKIHGLKSLLLVLLVVSSAEIAKANFSGTWMGQGQAETPKSRSTCDFIGIDLELREDKLILHAGQYQCAEISAEYPISTFTIGLNGELFYLGEKVGLMTEEQILLERPEEGFRLTLTKMSGREAIRYFEEWRMDSDFFLVSGELKKAPTSGVPFE